MLCIVKSCTVAGFSYVTGLGSVSIAPNHAPYSLVVRPRGPLPSLLRPRFFPHTICSLELITCPSPLFLLDIIRYLIVLCSFRTWLKLPFCRISLLLCAAVSSCPSRFTSLKHPWALQAENSRISVQISPTSVLF